MNGSVFVYEYSKDLPEQSNNGSVYVYEYSKDLPKQSNNGSVYVYEYSTPPSPSTVKVWNGANWVTKPSYIWNGTNWQQVL